MPVHAYLNFQGNARDAVLYYKDVFETEEPQILTFGDMPPNPDYPLPEEVKQYIMHTRITVCESTIMFSDTFPEMPFTVGNNLSLAIVSDDLDKLKLYFSRLKENGKVEMELQETEWSKCYGSVIDQFGVCWQFNYEEVEQ